MLPPNTILQNRYRVVRELGHGGMGTVYEAVDQRVNCIVALKETMAGHDSEGRRAFEREASLLANLRHSSLPKVMDYFTEGEGDFLVMEFIPGYDLAELLESRESPFPQSQVLRWAHELLRVLEYLHKQEPPILHRDIKPSNLKLTKQGEIFLLDFGLAKGSIGQMPTFATSRSVRGYTPVYASLEQIHGQGTDARSDLYSLGATLYHLFSGQPPVDSPSRFHALEEDQPDPLRPITALNPGASTNVAEVIERAMAVSRKQRPISAAEMRRALQNAAEEDERNSAEEEYRRAEERRRRRDDDQAQRAREAAQQVELEQQRREAKERSDRDEELRQQQLEQLREREAALRRAEQQRLEESRVQESLKATMPAPTVPAPQPPSRPAASDAAMPTMVAPPPERVRSATDTNRAFESFTPPVAASRSYFGVLLIAGLAVAIIVGFLIWSMTGTSENTNTTATNSSVPSGNEAGVTPRAPTGMVFVPGGTFMMGRDNGIDVAERPAHQVTVKPFFIDQYEVTNDGSYGGGADPLINVNWFGADDYCRKNSKRLPTEEEWEFAARGTDGRIFPWGNEWSAATPNAGGILKRVTKAGSFTSNAKSPFGVNDMVGNAWEWTASDFLQYPGGRLPDSVPAGNLKVIRGGSYESSKEYATTTYRTGWPTSGAKTYSQTGFRCAMDVK